jgi:hypothetical protein
MMAAARTDDEVPAEVHSDPLLANCLLAYVSDWTILDPVQIGVGKTWQTLDAMASLDHAMWFHRPVDFSDWLLYEQRSPSAVAAGVWVLARSTTAPASWSVPWPRKAIWEGDAGCPTYLEEFLAKRPR